MRFVLLVGCLSLSALAAVVTIRLRNLNQKFCWFRTDLRSVTARLKPWRRSATILSREVVTAKTERATTLCIAPYV